MSEAKKCDICGEFFALPIYYVYNSDPYLVHISPITNEFTQEYDLCPICSHELMEWIKDMKNDLQGEE